MRLLFVHIIAEAHVKCMKIIQKYSLMKTVDGEMMPTCRPEINEELVRKVKIAFPKETGMLGVAETVEWAMKKLLEKGRA